MTNHTGRTRTRRRVLGAASVVLGLLAVAIVTLALVSGGPRAMGSGAPTLHRTGGAMGEADGFIASGSAVAVDADVPAIQRLDPQLRGALQRAADDASRDAQVRVLVSSGWRSDRYQQDLLDRAIAEDGATAARERVQTPEVSRHTKGEAVDVAFTDADDWLDRNGAAYGLCQVYANEIWHFELLTSPGGACPAQRTDATAG